MESLGGDVRVEASERLGGARFVVTMPDARVEQTDSVSTSR